MDERRNLVRTGYNQCAQDYSNSRNLYKSQKYLMDLAHRLPDGAKVLDIGCGSGVPIDKFLLEDGFRVTGIDISEEQIRLAQKNLPQGLFTVQDMSQMDFPDDSFDAVVSFYAIFHIRREEHFSLLKKLHSIIKPGGYLLITMGSNEWEGVEADFYGVKMYWSHYGREKNLESVKQASFQVIYETIDTSGDERHLIIFARK